MGNKTALYNQHLKGQAKLVDFSGWEMPLHYGSQIQEHRAVRDSVGMFDVSHMLVVDFHGPDGGILLRRLLANNIGKLEGNPGSALYSAMLNSSGGVIDDLIAYFVRDHHFRVVSNCGTRTRVLEWYKEHSAGLNVSVQERNDLAIVAVQGPESFARVAAARPEWAELLEQLKPFRFFQRDSVFVARTGYTGEEGMEVILPNDQAESFWQALLEQGAVRCGLGARDTLRLEAGFNLYGQEMDEKTTPYSANMAWTLAFEPTDRDFIGRTALQKLVVEKQDVLVGLVLEERGVLRDQQPVLFPDSGNNGQVTSGTFSPTLNRSIGLARIPASERHAASCMVEIRGKLLRASVTSPCFVKNGEVLT